MWGEWQACNKNICLQLKKIGQHWMLPWMFSHTTNCMTDMFPFNSIYRKNTSLLEYRAAVNNSTSLKEKFQYVQNSEEHLRAFHHLLIHHCFVFRTFFRVRPKWNFCTWNYPSTNGTYSQINDPEVPSNHKMFRNCKYKEDLLFARI